MALIIDVETTGLPNKHGLPYKCIPDYKDIIRYNSARIVQFSAMLCNDKYEPIELYDTIIKLDHIHIQNSEFHGITDKISQTDGIPFEAVAEKIRELLLQSSCIIAHNIDFDIPVIKSELHRYGMQDIINIIDNKTQICTMKSTKDIVNIKSNYGYGNKYPSLAELHMHIFHEPIQNAHNSKYDVINLHRIIKSMYDNNLFIMYG